MGKHDLSKLATVIEEFQRDWPILVADEHLGQRFFSLLDDEELEEVFREFLVPVIYAAGPEGANSVPGDAGNARDDQHPPMLFAKQ